MQKQLLTLSFLCCTSLSVLAEESAPYTWTHTLTLESVSNLQGGIAEGTRNLANLDLTLAVDTQAADWWANGSFFVYVLGNYGKPPSALTGDLQTISNIETDNNLTTTSFGMSTALQMVRLKY